MYVLLILFRIIGTCTVDQDTSGFQGVPDIMDDAPPTESAKPYVIYAHSPSIRIFPEHALTGTRYVGDDHVEQMRQCLADLLRVIIDNDRVRAAPFSDILGQYITRLRITSLLTNRLPSGNKLARCVDLPPGRRIKSKQRTGSFTYALIACSRNMEDASCT